MSVRLSNDYNLYDFAAVSDCSRKIVNNTMVALSFDICGFSMKSEMFSGNF